MSGVGEGHPLTSPAVEAASPGALRLRARCKGLLTVFAGSLAICPSVRYGSGLKGLPILQGACRVVPGFGLRRTGRRFFVCPAKLGTKQDGMQKQDGVQFPAAPFAVHLAAIRSRSLQA